MSAVRRLLALAFLLVPRVADACAPAPPRGAEVMIAAEEAIILYDAATKTEHFIRRAQFDTTAKDFGFLVPTPSIPALAEADGRVFDRLRDATKEERKHETELDPEFSCLSALMLRKGAMSQAPPEVRVVSIQNVAGYEAAVLQANDAEALRVWLDKHGYDARPELTAWMTPYIANKWTITAFKIVGETSSSVRMTFTSDAPVFPYREPTDQAKQSYPQRVLRVFLVTSEKMKGIIGRDRPWPATLRYAKKVALPNEAVPANGWLQDFADSSTPRPGTDDLFFARDPDAAEITPPPLVEVSRRTMLIPLDLAAFIAIGAFFVVRLRRRPR